MTSVPEVLKDAVRGYADEERPLATYAVLTGAFNAALAAALAAASRKPVSIGWGDLILLGTATHKLSRILSKDKVTSFLRAPFTEYQEPGAPGEVEEKPRGTGARLAVGELLVCPYCLAPWVAAGLVSGSALAPRATRLFASVFGAVTISDFLQVAYKASEERA
jgi:hypothetical protein